MAAILCRAGVARGERPVEAAPVAPAPEAAQDPAARFAQGRAAYDAGRFEDAIPIFREVLEQSASPNARLYLARALRRTGRLADAYNEFRRAAQEADARARTEPRYGDTREAAREEAALIVGSVAFVTLVVAQAPPGADVRIAGQRTGPAIWGRPLARPPGRVRVEASAPGMTAVSLDVELLAGQDTRVRIPFAQASLENAVQMDFGAQDTARAPGQVETAPVDRDALDESMGARVPRSSALETARRAPDPSPEGPRPSAWVPIGGVALGVGVAGLAAGVTFAILGNERYATLRMMCDAPGVRCDLDPTIAPQVATGRTYDTVAVAGITAGSVLTVAGIAMLIGGVLQNEAMAAGARLAQPALVRLRPRVSPREGVGLELGGAF
jgi:hypothetical protein